MTRRTFIDTVNAARLLPDVEGLATTAAVQAGDQKALTDAKAYTDGRVADLRYSTDDLLVEFMSSLDPITTRMWSGPGRPDQPATTGWILPGREPVGAEYRSTDGAGVGAYVWMKRPGGKWEVTDGDTGWRDVRATATTGQWDWGHASSVLLVRRVGRTVHLRARAVRSAEAPTTARKVLSPVTLRAPLGAGVAPEQAVGMSWAAARLHSAGGSTPVGAGLLHLSGDLLFSCPGDSDPWVGGEVMQSQATWTVDGTWPTTLPGTPA